MRGIVWVTAFVALALFTAVTASSVMEQQLALRRLMTAGPDALKAAKPELFRHFDIDGDGRLDKAEYQRFIAAFAAEHQIRAGRPEAEAIEHSVNGLGLEESFAQAKRRYDADGDEHFDKVEWANAIDDAAEETL